MENKKTSPFLYISVLLFLGLIAAVAYFLHTQRTLEEELVQLTNLHESSLQALLASSTAQLEAASTTIAALSEELNITAEELEDIESDYSREKQKNEDFEDEYRDAITTIRDLDKLSKTDSELLQKYSKVSFLNEHYIPESLKEVKPEWKYTESKPNQLHSKVMPFMEDMLEAAKDDGVDIYVVSAYRSFDTQAQLKGAYTVQYGSGANAFSADQGFSEHQLGTTVDFTTTGLGGGLDGFGNTPAFAWLEDNASKYGFTLSYPEGNQYYVYEPWHWRFVGTDLALDLDKQGKTFYDLEQREISTYLLNIFD